MGTAVGNLNHRNGEEVKNTASKMNGFYSSWLIQNILQYFALIIDNSIFGVVMKIAHRDVAYYTVIYCSKEYPSSIHFMRCIWNVRKLNKIHTTSNGSYIQYKSDQI